MKWTKQEEDVLRRCMEKGLSNNEIGKVLTSRSQDSIANKINALGLKSLRYQQPAHIDYSAFQNLTGEVLDL